MFHPDCVLEYLETQIKDSVFPLMCPGDKCGLEIHMLDLQERLSPETMAKFEEFSLNSFV